MIDSNINHYSFVWCFSCSITHSITPYQLYFFTYTIETIEETKKRDGGTVPRKTIEIGSNLSIGKIFEAYYVH